MQGHDIEGNRTMSTLHLLGQFVYGFLIFFVFSGFVFMWKSAQTGGVVSHRGIFQIVFALGCIFAFGFTSMDKAHLLWAVPLGYLISLTPLGNYVGRMVSAYGARK